MAPETARHERKLVANTGRQRTGKPAPKLGPRAAGNSLHGAIDFAWLIGHNIGYPAEGLQQRYYGIPTARMKVAETARPKQIGH